jgi:hypothetical protein
MRRIHLFLAFLFILLASSILASSSAHAGLILNHPTYVGLTDGLVGWWSFDGKDMSGTKALDRSGQGNDGTLTNGPVRTLGKIGQALEFDGVDDLVNVGTSDELLPEDAPLTICAWIFPRNLGTGLKRIVERRTPGEISFFTNVNNVVTFAVVGSTNLSKISVENSISLNTWQLACVTWDGGTMASNAHIYINALEVGYQTSINLVTPTNTFGASTSIGNRITGFRQFDGLIDDVRIYNRALSADEIKRLYRIGATLHVNTQVNNDSLSKGLVGWWTFDGQDTAGSIIYDRSGQGNNGFLNGASSTNPRVKGKLGQALSFDGVDDYVNIARNASLEPANAITVSTWFYWDDPSNSVNAPIVGIPYTADQEPYLSYLLQQISTSNDIGFAVTIDGSRDVGVSKTVTTKTWHHLVGTWSSSERSTKLYVDGAVAATNTTNSGTLSYYNEPLRIGWYSFPATRPEAFIDGLIDDVRIYNRALTADEIKRLYRIGATLHVNTQVNNDSLSKGLVGWWTFDGKDMNATEALDRSGQGNDGTLTNGPVRAKGKLGQALEFDGVNDYVSVSGSTQYVLSSAPFSAGAWVYLTQFVGTEYMTVLTLRSDTTNPYTIFFSNDTSNAFLGVNHSCLN